MNFHGIFPTEDDLREMIERVDRNSNGTVDYEEFVKMMMDISQVNQQEKEEDIEQAFKIFDKVLVNRYYILCTNVLPKDGDGLITAEEIRLTMTGLGEELSEAELTAMVAEADLNGDGYIDFSEFSNLMRNKFGLGESGSICQEL